MNDDAYLWDTEFDESVEQARLLLLVEQGRARRVRQVKNAERGRAGEDMTREQLATALVKQLETVCHAVYGQGSAATRMPDHCGELADLLVEAIRLYDASEGKLRNTPGVPEADTYLARHLWKVDFGRARVWAYLRSVSLNTSSVMLTMTFLMLCGFVESQGLPVMVSLGALLALFAWFCAGRVALHKRCVAHVLRANDQAANYLDRLD